MSTDRPAPHPAFWITWVFWYVVISYSFFAIHDTLSALASLSALVYFFVPELIAKKIQWRWTLSATMTWVVQKMSHHQIPFRGWNLLLVPAASIPSIVMLRIGWQLGGWWGISFASLLAFPSAIMCHEHWLRPDLNG